MKNLRFLSLIWFCSLFSCLQTDDFEVPSTNAIQGIEPKMTLTEFLEKYGEVESPTYIANNRAVFTAYVVSSAQDGNMPYTISIQENIDGGPGIKIPTDRFNYSGFYPVGQKLIINANRLFVGKLNNTITLGSGQGSFWSITDAMRPQHLIKTNERVRDSVMTPEEIKKSLPAGTVYLKPKKTTIAQIKSGLENYKVGTLIRLDGVFFEPIFVGHTFLTDGKSRNIKIQDKSGESIDFRIESSANFANQIIPDGEGNLVAVLDKFQNDFQLRIRDLRDLSFPKIPKIFFTTKSLTLDEGNSAISLEVELSDAVASSFSVDVKLISGDSSLVGGFSTQTLNFSGLKGEKKSIDISVPLDADGDQIFVFQLQNLSNTDVVRIDGNANAFGLTVLDKNAPLKEEILIFNEYLEGSSNNKYLEIKNIGNKAADLSQYKIELYINGNTALYRTQNLSELVGGPITLAENEVLVLKKSTAVLVLPDGVVAYNSSVVDFTGNDALLLKKNETIVDKLGVVGIGDTWTVAGFPNASTDKGLRRKSTVTVGATDWSASAGTNTENSQWIVVLDTDNTSDLGF